LATSTLISRRRLGGHDPWVNNPKLYQPKALPQVWSYPGLVDGELLSGPSLRSAGGVILAPRTNCIHQSRTG